MNPSITENRYHRLPEHRHISLQPISTTILSPSSGPPAHEVPLDSKGVSVLERLHRGIQTVCHVRVGTAQIGVGGMGEVYRASEAPTISSPLTGAGSILGFGHLGVAGN